MNNCFHAGYPQRLRRLLHERETQRLLKGGQTKACLNRGPLVWPQKSFDPDGVWETLSRFLLKLVPFSSSSFPPHYHSSTLSVSGRAVKAERGRERQQKPPSPSSPPRGSGVSSARSWAPLWHTDSFTWCETLHGALNLDSFYHNRITRPPTPPRLCLSFVCRCKQPQLRWFCFFIYIF